jgi:hypothetical protein
VSSFELDEDWGDMVEQEPEPAASQLHLRQEGKTLTSKELESPSAESTSLLEASNSQVDEDWGWEDMVEQDLETVPGKVVPSLDSLDLEEDDEWDDWVVEEPEPLPKEPIAEMDFLDLGEDDDWGDLVEDSDPFAAAPKANRSASDLEIDEDWDDWDAQPKSVQKRIPPPPPPSRLPN